MKKVFAVFLLVLLGGCSWLGEDTYMKWEVRRTRIISIINDSLAILQNVKVKMKCGNHYDTALEDWCEDMGEVQTRLFMINYRKETEPLLKGEIDLQFDIHGQLSDSTVYGFNDSAVVFWNIDKTPIVKNINKIIGNDSFSIGRMRQWKDGKFLILPKEQNLENELNLYQYAVLDTAREIITQKLFENNDAWLAECEDFALFDEKIVCLRRPNDGSCGVEMVVDNKIVDSRKLGDCDFRYPSFVFYGKYIIDNVKYKVPQWEWKYSSNRIYKIFEYKFQYDYPEIWVEYFGQANSNIDFSDSLGLIKVWYVDW